MKNARIQPLILLTCIFAVFLVGLFAGRSMNRTPVQIALPASETVCIPVATEKAGPTEPSLININTATAEQLQRLPNIGPKTAEQIIAYRNEHGAFQSVGELIYIPGIGEKKLEAIWDLITIGG